MSTVLLLSLELVFGVDNDGHCSIQDDCGLVHLESLEESWVDVDKLIFIESSGSSNLSTRYLCALESAAKVTQLPIIVLMTSPVLNVSSSNASIHLLSRSQSKLFHFRHADPVKVLQDSPFGNQVWIDHGW